jgi:glycosyltransferase involved in cell wall biosynthesis
MPYRRLEGATVGSRDVILIGIRPQNFARHSGYDGFSRYVGHRLKPPVNFRRGTGVLAKLVNSLVTSVTRHPGYSIGAFLTECAAVLHMAGHRTRLYHLLYGDTGLWMLGRASRTVGGRVIATFHRPPSVLERYGILNRARDLHAVLLVSDSQRPYFEKVLPPKRVFVVPHGVDTDFFRPRALSPTVGQDQGEGDVPSDEQVCITVGAYLRDFETLAAALGRVWKVRPNVRVVAIGTNHPQDVHFKSIKDSRLQLLAGVSDEQLRHAYQRSTVAVFSFLDATANNSLLEAMACGLPVVSTDVGGVRQYLGEEAGILCPARDPDALATGMLRVLDDPRDAARMGAAARARALSYDFRIVAEQMRQVYSELLGVS